MAHIRQQIRAEFVALLTGLPLTASRIESSRVYPIRKESGHYLIITTPTDDVDSSRGVLSEFKEFRRLRVEVQCVVKAVANYEDILDDICAQVSARLFANDRLSGLGDLDELLSTSTSFDGEGDQPMGVATMSFIVLYRVDELDPTVSI